MEVGRIVGDAWQQFAGTRCCNDRRGTIGPCLRGLRIERYGEMQELTRVGVRRGEQCRVAPMQMQLIDRYLRLVFRESLDKTVPGNSAPVLGVEALGLPQTRKIEMRIWQVRTFEDQSVGVPAEGTIKCLEGEIGRIGRELVAALDELLARPGFEEVAAFKDPFHARRKLGFTPPFILNAPGAVFADDACAEVRPRQFALDSALDQGVDRDAGGFQSAIGDIEVGHHYLPGA